MDNYWDVNVWGFCCTVFDCTRSKPTNNSKKPGIILRHHCGIDESGLSSLYTNQVICDLIEEILAPYCKFVGILNERQHVLLGLIVVNRCKPGAEKAFQLVNIQRCFRFQETGLPEPGFQMFQIDWRLHGEIEHIVIEIAALDAVLPSAAQHRMYLPRK